jgi:uncharacterized radical SAM superfamily protein
MPIIQNVRGCPFNCAYCVSGRQSSRLRSFSVERICAEIEYLRKKTKNKILRFSDDNFGINDHDLQLAEFLKKTRDTYKYPSTLKMYSAKQLNEQTRKIAWLLKDLNIMNISFQSLNPEVLKNIHRRHNSLEEILSNLNYAHQNNIPTGTELIFGLPGETLESFKEVIDKTVEFRFDSVILGVLWMLKGSELATEEGRKKYAYQTKFMLAENALTLVNGEVSFEADELAISSNSYTFADYKTFLQYQFICDFAVSCGFAKELLFHALSFGIKPSAVFNEMIDNPATYPAINKKSLEFQKYFVEHMFATQKELESFIKENINQWVKNKENITSFSKARTEQEFFAALLYDDPAFSVFNEFAKAVNKLFAGSDKEEFTAVSEHIKNLSVKLIINPRYKVEDKVIFKSPFNLLAWVEDGYQKPLREYKISERQFILRPRNYEFINYIVEKDRDERKNCYNFFRNTNSSDRKRIITA